MLIGMSEEKGMSLPSVGSAEASPSHSAASLTSLPQRSRPVHGVHVELNKATIVFLTVCTKDRRRYLATEEMHAALIDVWQAATAWLVGRYVVMPDHIHLFAAPTGSEIPFDNWVRFWKSQFTKRCPLPEHRWHPDHWDRRLRSGESYEEKWEYVRNNPVRHGLVSRPEDWPFQGEVNELAW